MTVVWVIEHYGGDDEDRFSEVMGVYDAEQIAKDAWPNVAWEHLDFVDEDDEIHQAWDAAIGHGEFLVLYTVVLNTTYPAIHGSLLRERLIKEGVIKD